ncbi:MAG: DUF1576 domain-containing protein [Sphaerochaetaceae bacterium]|nr:DUF1576 domain-containing protein [Sphaerochaetaceae bacterium]MDD4219142.1 DUF1576 domain-containing protein [Sphaerochaetaceae bacterium]
MIEKHERIRYIALLCMLLGIILAGFTVDGVHKSLVDFIKIQTSSSRLIQDFTAIGVGGALVNASLVALIGLSLVFFSSVSLSGPTLAAVFTLLGFGLFGKTPLNNLPIMAGVWIAARFARKTLGSYSLIALFGTALGPLVTYLMFETALPLPLSIPVAIMAGLVTGIILPAIAGSMLQLHHGYNLYNIGFSCGFIGLFASSALRASNRMQPIFILWNTQRHVVLVVLIPAVVILLFSVGIISSHGSPKKLFTDTKKLQRLSGRLPTDYFDVVDSGAPWLNMGLLGIASVLFVLISGAPFNGPVLGGIFTVIGFGAFGKSLKNCWPVVLGVCLGTWLFGKTLADPGPILAALFATTLAPIAGQFGIITGIIAGFIHLIVVESTAAWHGGLDLYNNGFAGGLTATFLIAILQWYQTNRSKEDFKS